MKRSGKPFLKLKKEAVSFPQKPSPFPSSIGNPKKPLNPYLRLAMVAALLALGGYLIETPSTLGRCLLGFVMWGTALFLSLDWFPSVPGIRTFSQSPLQVLKGSKEGGWPGTVLAGAGIWTLLGLSNRFIQWGHWGLLGLSLLFLGFLFFFLEKHSPAFWSDNPGPGLPDWREIAWAGALILLVGSFFLFYGGNIFPIGHDNDAGISMEISDSYLFKDGRTTPYVDGFSWGNPAMPFFFIGLFLKVVGSSPARAVIFVSILNLVGYLFFYGFLRHYLSKISALASTLLFLSCYWVIYWARQPSPVGFVLPFECANLFFFVRAIEKGKTRDFALLGTVTAFFVMVALHGRALVALMFLGMVALAVFHKREMWAQKKSWILALGAALVWYLPMFLYHYQKSVPFLGSEVFARDNAWGDHFHIPWGNIRQGLQMFNFRTTDPVSAYMARLSPWEGLLLLAGFGWCLRRFFNPAFMIALFGFFLGLAPAVLSNKPTLSSRAIAVAPFVFLLVGIGLDRLSRTVAAPLGSRGKALRLCFIGLFLALSMGWEYNVFFQLLPRNVASYSADGSDRRCEQYVLGSTITHYMHWDTDVESLWWQQNSPDEGTAYTIKDMFSTQWERITFWPASSPMPLQQVPSNDKGLAFLFSDRGGKAFQDWIHYYYPDAQSRVILNPFGDVEIRAWEISIDAILKALPLNSPPPGGLLLSWYDSKNRRLGQWHIPSLCSDVLNNDYLRSAPGVAGFPWEKVAYFTAQGSLNNTDGRPLIVDTNGKVDASFNGRKFHWAGAGYWNHFVVPALPKGWVSFQIRYVPPRLGDFGLGLARRDPLGWTVIPSNDWRTASNHAEE